MILYRVLIVFALLMFWLPYHMLSQEVTDNEEITVVAPYKPTVDKALKINISPKIVVEELEKPEFDYKIVSREYKAVSSLEPIVPAQIQGESVSKLFKNYIKAGFGNYGTPYFEFFANKLRSKKNAFGVHLKHRSSSGKINDYAYPGNALNRINIYGKKFMRSHTFKTNVFYQRQGVHFYGYKPDDYPEFNLSKKDIRQNYNQFGFNASIESNYQEKKTLDHEFKLGYFLLNEKYRKPENNLMASAKLNLNTDFFSFSDQEKLGIDAGMDYFVETDSVLKQNAGVFNIDPYYTLAFDQYYFKVGFNTNITTDSVAKVHVYPVVRAEIKVIQDYLITYAGIYGEIKRNSLRSLSAENFFINPYLEKRFTNNKISQYGGIKGKVSTFMDYNLTFINSTIRGMPFFVNDTLNADGLELGNQFMLVYDDVKYTRLIAEFGFHISNDINVLLRGQYNDYFLDNEDKAWHKPKLEISLGADYSIRDKIILRGELFTRSKMYARVYEKNLNSGIYEFSIETLDAMIDLNLGMEYRYSNKLSGFLNLNNILGQRYYHWYNYPSYRFNFLLGLTYSF